MTQRVRTRAVQRAMCTPRAGQPAYHSSATARRVYRCCAAILPSFGLRASKVTYSMPPRSPRSKAGSRNVEKALHVQRARKHHKLVCVAVLNTDCVVCLNEQRSHIFGPCGHYCVCKECCEIIMNSSQSCPLCRNGCAMSMRVFL